MTNPGCELCGRPHGPGHWNPGLSFECLQIGCERLKREVAAAEERGRRRGIEEAIRITESADAFAIPTDPPGKYLKLVCKQLRAALAPRDSGKEGQR